jgi:hypothetical protein
MAAATARWPGDVLQELRLLPVLDEELRSEPELVVYVGPWRRPQNVDEPIGVLIRQRREQHVVDHGEHAGAGANGESQHADQHAEEPGGASERTRRVAQVTCPLVEHFRSA